MLRVLVTTTSFVDTPGAHRELLKAAGYELVMAKGPFSETGLLDLIAGPDKFDGFLCGEDEFTANVLAAAAPRAKIISKYGVGLDRIDLEAAKKLQITVSNTPGVNHTTVSELTFGLLLSLLRKIPEHSLAVQNQQWRRMTGSELAGKTLGVVGLGRVGKEVVKRAGAFGMNILVFNTNWNNSHSNFLTDVKNIYSSSLFTENGAPISVSRAASVDELLQGSDLITLHMNLTKENTAFLNRERISRCKRGIVVVNVSRGALIDHHAMAEALRRGHVAGYAADVLEKEPVQPDCPLLGAPNVIITPHIGSRTLESVVRQGCAAAQNLITALDASLGEGQS